MEYIIIGKIINTHGIKGEVKIQPLTGDVNRFNILNEVYLGESKDMLTVERSRLHKNNIILKFKEFNNINDILKYKESYIYIDMEDRLELPENEFYIFELIGLKIFDIKGGYIGELIDVIQGASNDVYLIETPRGEAMIPAVREFIKKIDIENKTMTVSLIEGMIE